MRSSSVEDKRFWTDPGVDIRGIARAFWPTSPAAPRQGASTIAQQFVKNALAEQDNRTIFEKLREAALAYHLTHKWKKTKILTEYLNSIYFGNGAYGVESAARVYFGKAARLRPGRPAARRPSATSCGDADSRQPAHPRVRSGPRPWEAALLAGMVASPTAFDPLAHPRAAAKARRNLVLRGHARSAATSPARSTRTGSTRRCRTASRHPAAARSQAAAPYFTSWLRPQILAAMERHGVPPKRRRVPRLLRRPEDPHHARPRAAAGGRAGDLRRSCPTASGCPRRRWWRSTTRPARSGRWSAGRSSTARRTTTSSRSTSPPKATASRARRSSPSRSPRRCETGEYGADSVIDLRAPGLHRPQQRRQGALHRPQLRQHVLRPDHARRRDRVSDNSVFSQVGIQRRHQADRQARASADGHPLDGLRPTTR